jgi:hypothetical protein
MVLLTQEISKTHKGMDMEFIAIKQPSILVNGSITKSKAKAN